MDSILCRDADAITRSEVDALRGKLSRRWHVPEATVKKNHQGVFLTLMVMLWEKYVCVKWALFRFFIEEGGRVFEKFTVAGLANGWSIDRNAHVIKRITRNRQVP